ncbi:hypothetical protein KM1_072880 [Entamoeba histolytica HM-3:IMSS]|uniref:Coiled-coil c1d domain protein n=3 Tax=Entamoeba TaxID=5758 RepID=A0A175JJN9_ENTHI|nr:hypothetical protein KM1_072880 [Entamoeba histolytica HM-3:IMSS]GAT93642.1 coiled-coil c1d domain protein [Entamoeba histolytica]
MSTSTNQIITNDTLELLDEDDIFEDFNDFKTKDVDDSTLHWQDNWEDEGADEFTNHIRSSLLH